MIDPLAEISTPPYIAALPRADIHIHAEWSARLDRVLAHREGRRSYQWHDWAVKLMLEPPGMPRLQELSKPQIDPHLDAIPENFVARVEDLLREAAADAAVLVEARFGKDIERPNFMELFREAERRVQANFPHFHAVPTAILLLWLESDQLERIIQNVLDIGIRGVDMLYRPYDAEADWSPAYRIAERLSNEGLGITVHAGEFSKANLAAALRVPGLKRIGHAVYAGDDPSLLEEIARRQITVECSLSCNVILGASASYETHPIHRFVEYGIPVALCTDNPVQMGTTIGREYTIAHQLGFSEADLLQFTRNAIQAAFISAERREKLLDGPGSVGG